MTAEIAMLNNEAIALAADSAVSFSTGTGFKVLPSANKIFALSKYHPVGAMVYGNATLMGAPWELLIKAYRRQLGTKRFPRLVDYANDFLTYLGSSDALLAEPVRDQYVMRMARDVTESTREKILEAVKSELDAKGEIGEQDVSRIAKETIHAPWEAWRDLPLSDEMPADFLESVRARYAEGIRQTITDVFENGPLDDEDVGRLIDLVVFFSTKLPPRPGEGESGLVVAGYGDQEFYPVLRSYRIESVLCGCAVRCADRHHDVATNGSGIVPFAQSEMVYAFMEGVEPRYQAAIDAEIQSVLLKFAEIAADDSGVPEAARENFRASLQELARRTSQDFATSSASFRRKQFAAPTIDIASILPKDELAAMAESLVNLTAFRRRMSMDAETVGGPVDVAVISKGDGFVWIKRKHYFTKELNPQFFANYYREASDEQERSKEEQA